MQRPHEVGRPTRLDDARSLTLLDQLRSSIAPLEAWRSDALVMLASLPGKAPTQFDATLSNCTCALRLAQPSPVGDGGPLTRRRTDVHVARQKLAGATAEIGVTTADLFAGHPVCVDRPEDKLRPLPLQRYTGLLAETRRLRTSAPSGSGEEIATIRAAASTTSKQANPTMGDEHCRDGYWRRGVLRCMTAWILSFGALRPAHGLDPTIPLNELEHVVFHPRDGAPSHINDLQQTPDGLLWLATNSGLFQFDGAAFRRYEAPDGQQLPDLDIYSLATTPSGALLAGTRFGHVYRIERGGFHQYGQADGLPAHTICALGADASGKLWAGMVRTGVYRLAESRWEAIPQMDGTPVPVIGSNCLATDRDGSIWATSVVDVFHLAPAAARFQSRSRDLRGIGLGFILDRDGHAWLSNDRGFLSLTTSNSGLSQAALNSIDKGDPTSPAFIAYIDHAGMAWGWARGSYFRLKAPSWGTRGLLRSAAELQILPKADRRSLARPSYARFLEDKEGNVWVATGGGLERFRATKFRRAISGDRTLDDAALATSPSGTLWVATSEGMFRRDPGGSLIPDSRTAHPPNLWPMSMLATSDGQVYLGGDELNRWTSAGLVPMPTNMGGKPLAVHAMTERIPGEVWLSAIEVRALFVGHNGDWVRRDGAGGVPAGPALSMAADAGRVWLGYPDDTVAMVDPLRARSITAADGLDVGSVMTILPRGDTAWIGGSLGLAYFDGKRAHTVRDASHIQLTSVTGIIATPDGELWLNDEAGVQRIPASELAALVGNPDHQPAMELFGVHAGIDGSPARIQPLPSTARTPDGRLWFSTSTGLYSIDPRHIIRNTIAPQPQLIAVLAGGAAYRGAVVKLPAYTEAFEVGYTAPALGVPELTRFKYRLKGVDKDWQDAGERRQAFYTNVVPGRYVFEVMAANEDNLWSVSPAAVAITIAPAFWQTGWFLGLCIALMAMLVVAAVLFWHRVRLVGLERSLRRDARIQNNERERIARDLHDTLLQDMYGLVWRIEAIARRIASTDPRREELKQALDRADGAIRDGRDRVMNLHEQAPDSRPLLDRLASLGERWAEDTGTAFKLDASAEVDRALRPAVRDSLERILAEAIANAFRHANATTVLVRLIRRESKVVGEVVDDGIGMPIELIIGRADGHLGLQVMRDRTSALGATLEITPVEPMGTSVRVTLSSRRAYAKTPSPRWIAWRRATGSGAAARGD